MQVKGLGIRIGEPGCAHWSTPRDIVAIRLPCCADFYACHECHATLAEHAPQRWPQKDWTNEKAILCRACNTAITIAAYMDSGNHCPHCAADFNPGCKNHWNLYFVTENTSQKC